mmetsp:Transcript_41372/g.107079  ORF Transcript_41372/g.107079 Transcript_41372/m.107079 type:complete len:257 (+) Transcript_41372:74-844(+)|eukprot:CAMPEP_0195073966 /NCGR_PEP_ID=MMETSP0448-20130528/17175_1 /TAXON_ID=66468 /ORGANISM="Heterocapsa triquestra, Strain CCMP 448" /LENGTH=256 /DNA_ID=CAMNT_0040106141 /DNA_START=63 /DNA_END=833 /DNA_ORIENTATION=-
MSAAMGGPTAGGAQGGTVLGAGGEPLVYPSPLFVRNTFIDCAEARPSSLDGFFEERLVASCPASKLSDPGQGEIEEENTNVEVTTAPSTRQSAWAALQNAWASMTAGGHSQRGSGQEGKRAAGVSKAPGAKDSATPNSDASTATGATLEGAAAALAASSAAPPRAAASEAAGALLPSAGSEGHYEGTCKPCAFVNAKGCKSGYSCQFCHLCDAGEKKRRQKEKRAFFATMRSVEANGEVPSEGWTEAPSSTPAVKA